MFLVVGLIINYAFINALMSKGKGFDLMSLVLLAGFNLIWLLINNHVTSNRKQVTKEGNTNENSY